MPYKSERQRRYLHSQKPEVAAKYDAHEDKKKPVKRTKKKAKPVKKAAKKRPSK